MTFDPLAWGLGFALNRLTARVLKPSPADELRARLRRVAAHWAEQLPPDASVGYERIFLEAAAEPDPEFRPARFQLQESLYTAGVVPTEQMWCEAFVEHWSIKRAELGERGNAFFQLGRDEAIAYLADLARRIHHVCQADPELARRTTILKLDKLLEHQDAELLSRKRMALVPYYARDLPQEIQALTIDRPDSWEPRLFSAVLSFELSLQSSLRRDYRSEVPWGRGASFRNREELFDWLRAHISEAEGFGARATHLLNQQLPVALGPTGVPGDPEAIIDVARKLGEVHRRGIEWVLTLRRSVQDPLFSRLAQLLERLAEDMIRQIQEFAEELAVSIGEVLAIPDGTPTTIALTLTLTVPEGVPEELDQEFARLRTHFDANPFDLL